MPRVPVAYENPRHAKYFDEVVRTVARMSGKCDAESAEIVEGDRQYVDSAIRGGVPAQTAAAVVFHKHVNGHVVAGSPAVTVEGHVPGTPLKLSTRLESDVGLKASCPPPTAVPPGGDDLQPCGPFSRVIVDDEKLQTCRKAAVALGSLTKPENVYALVRSYMERETVEIFVVLGFDVNMVVNCYAEVARGQVDHVAVAPQDIMALVLKSKAFLVAHSHPSGDATPSRDDAVLTQKIREAAAVFPGLVFLDHLVIGHGEFYSFAEKKKQKA